MEAKHFDDGHNIELRLSGPTNSFLARCSQGLQLPGYPCCHISGRTPLCAVTRPPGRRSSVDEGGAESLPL